MLRRLAAGARSPWRSPRRRARSGRRRRGARGWPRREALRRARRRPRRDARGEEAREEGAGRPRPRVRVLPQGGRGPGLGQAARGDRRRSAGLIDLGGGSDQDTPQWYFRLAELLWEESQYFFFEANRRDDRLIALGTKGDPREIDRLMAEKKELEAQQKKHRDQAVALYGAIIKRYPKYPRLDEVLYFLAENLSKRNRNDPDAIKAYGALIQRFPKSRFVPDAWMAVGEYWFEKATGDARTQEPQEGARGVPEGGGVPGVHRLRLRALQAGVGPLQPRRPGARRSTSSAR